MKYIKYTLVFSLLNGSVFFGCVKENANLIVEKLRCCNRVNPEGIEYPSFAWKIKTNEQGISQTAWEIQIADSKDLLIEGKANVWKSGKSLSDAQLNIIPQDISFRETEKYFWRVRIWDNKGNSSTWSEPSSFSIGIKEESWTGKWITYPYSKDMALPYFRKIFQTKTTKTSTIKRATLYFCGLGAGEVYLNGQPVDSTRFLDPAQTNYDQYALYSTYDVTDLIQRGNNCIGAMLGNGWFSQDAAWNGVSFYYGPPMLRAQLVLVYDDGTQSIINSDESWRWTEGPVIRSNIYLGEFYDARCEIQDWCSPEFEADNWKKVALAESNIPPCLKPQMINPIRKRQVIKAVDMWKDAKGAWIFDFGVNVAGITCLRVHQPEGTRLRIRIAEEIKKDSSLDFSSLGWTHHGKIFKNEYICGGDGIEDWKPSFTYHGLRFAELSGYKGKPDLSTISLVVVRNDLERRGSFECSEQQINQLHEMAIRTVLSNLHGFPTDCPNREKCGWLGDVHAYVKMANVNLQMNNFWIKYLDDIRSGANYAESNTLFHEKHNTDFYYAKKSSGLPYMIAPGKRLCGVATPDWGTTLVQLPWWLYIYYGNIQVLNDFYPSMKQWTDYVSGLAGDTARTYKYSKNTKYIIYQGLGDWCPPGGNDQIDTPVEFTSTAFHYLDVCIMKQAASILGFEADVEKYTLEKELISREMITTLYDASEKTFGSQTADIMALDFGLVPPGDEFAVANAVVCNMDEEHEGFMHCGIFGIGRIGSMLARHRQTEAAYKLFVRTGENSFTRMWEQAKATSLWEILPVSKDSEIIASKDSHNHPMQAGYDICFYEDIAGIRTDSSGPGYKVIRFEPLFMDLIDWAKAEVESPYGTILSNWKHSNGEIEWKISIPANSSGLIVLPSNKKLKINEVTLNNEIYTTASIKDIKSIYHLPSGYFNIRIYE